MKTWPTKKLGEVCEIIGGGTPKTAISEYWNGDIVWITPKDLGKLENGEIFDSSKKISKEGLKKSSARLLPKGTVVLSSRAPIGYVAIASIPLATNQGCRNFVCGNNIYNHYLYYFLKSSTNLLNSLGSGSTFSEISGSRLKQLEIPLPPLEIQRKIVAKLEGLLGKIKEAKRLRAEAEDAVQNLLPAELHKIFSEGKKKEWEEKELGDVLDYEQPTKYIVNSVDYSNEYKIPVLTAGKTFILGYTNEKDNIFSVEELPVIIFDDFTTAIKFVDFPFKVKSSAMKILRAKKEKVNTNFLFYIMQTLKLNHDTHKRYWISEYSNIKIPLPPIAEQKKIVAYLDSLFEKTKQIQTLQFQTAADFTNLEQSILHKAFSGELIK
ncbi:MAG: restriction endonuclease subunit S [bacterium]|nr:restriction endonuclease subunit S [bacterium]